jgi:uncharacterized membrane protein
MMTLRDWIEIILAFTVPATAVGMIINRIISKKGLGVRAIQFLAVSLGIPIIAILALEKVLEGAVVGTLLGGIFGYLLSNISNYDKQPTET